MGFLRRVLSGGSNDSDGGSPAAAADGDASTGPDEAESAREIAMIREEQARLDELAQRQLRYARFAWQPPAQGGDRRADDGAADAH